MSKPKQHSSRPRNPTCVTVQHVPLAATIALLLGCSAEKHACEFKLDWDKYICVDEPGDCAKNDISHPNMTCGQLGYMNCDSDDHTCPSQPSPTCRGWTCGVHNGQSCGTCSAGVQCVDNADSDGIVRKQCLAASETGGVGGSSTTPSTGGTRATGGTNATGGTRATGGMSATGGANSAGGTRATGGMSATGGTNSTGGTRATGGMSATGGMRPSGGNSSSGGTRSTGGMNATGGAWVNNPNVCDDTASTSASLSGQYARAYINTVNATGRNYVAMTNWWGLYTTQTLSINGIGFTVNNSVTTVGSDPLGFPSILIGTYQNNATTGSNLPKQLAAITSIPTVLDTNATSLDTSYFVTTFDVWLTANSTPLSGASVSSPGTGGAEVMVWLYQPAYIQPLGTIKASSQTVGNLGGTWNVWVDSTSPPTISYVATTPVSTVNFDLKSVLTDSVKYGVVTSMYVSIISAGFSIWTGANGAKINRFCAKVN